MAKRVTAIRQAYQREQKRINRALLKLRAQGYDISNVKLPAEPKRVTKKALAELQEITPKKLRLQVTYKGYVPPKGTPLRTDGHFTTTKEARERAHRLELQRIDRLAKEAEREAELNRAVRQQEMYDEWKQSNPPTTEELYNQLGITEEPEPVVTDDTFVDTYVEPSPEEIIDEEPHETYPSIEDNEVVYRDVITGEEVDRAPLAIDTTDNTVYYLNAETGEVIKEEQNLWDYQGYDATELAMHNLRSIVNAFPASIANHFNELLDRMITQHGVNAVGNAIQTWELDNGQSILEALQAAPNAYEELVNIFSELVEKLPFTDEEKEQLRVEFSLHEPYEEVT